MCKSRSTSRWLLDDLNLHKQFYLTLIFFSKYHRGLNYREQNIHQHFILSDWEPKWRYKAKQLYLTLFGMETLKKLQSFDQGILIEFFLLKESPCLNLFLRREHVSFEIPEVNDNFLLIFLQHLKPNRYVQLLKYNNLWPNYCLLHNFHK
jgi:hypothetical protein